MNKTVFIESERCYYCDRGFKSMKKLAMHNVYFHRNCNICTTRTSKFSTVQKAIAHMKKEHGGIQFYQVNLRAVDNEKIYRCEICNSGFNSSQTLKNHMEKFHKSKKLQLFEPEFNIIR